MSFAAALAVRPEEEALTLAPWCDLAGAGVRGSGAARNPTRLWFSGPGGGGVAERASE